MTYFLQKAVVVMGSLGLTICAWAAPLLSIGPDDRVDLVSIVFHYAGNKEYNKVFFPEYAQAMEERFADLKEHPVIAMAREFRQDNGVSFDAVVSFAILLDSTESMRLYDGMIGSLDSRWPRDRVDEFLAQLRDFARQSNFSEFYAAQVSQYDGQCEFWRKILDEAKVISWVEHFYGESRPLHFMVIPSALMQGGKGPGYEFQGIFYCFMIAEVVNYEKNEDDQRFKRAISRFIAHEFSHPGTNPVTEQMYPQIQETVETFYPKFHAIMDSQAYGTPKIMMIETMNRAATAVYVHDQWGDEAAVELLNYEREKGFILSYELYRCILAEREKHGDSWRFADSIQAYIGCINSEKSKALFRSIPTVIAMQPENGGQNIDPATTAITFTFDQPMQTNSMSICLGEKGQIPQIESYAFNADGTVLSLKVKLEPNTKYRFWLNREKHRNFIGVNKGVLLDTEYFFTTGSGQ